MQIVIIKKHTFKQHQKEKHVTATALMDYIYGEI